MFLWPALTVHSQTELGLNIYGKFSDLRDGVAETHTVVADTYTAVSDTRIIVSGVQRGVADTSVVVSEVQRNVAHTNTMVSEIRREILGSQKGTDGQLQSVSDHGLHLPLNARSLPPRLKLGQQTLLPTEPVSYISI